MRGLRVREAKMTRMLICAPPLLEHLCYRTLLAAAIGCQP